MSRQPATQQISPFGSAGFSLVEVLVAMGIVVTCLLGLLEVMGLSTTGNVKNQLRDEAVQIGEAQIAEMMHKPKSVLVPLATVSVPSRFRGGTKQYAVTRVAEPIPGSNSYQFIITVKWAFKNLTSVYQVKTVRSYKDGE